MTAVIEGGDVVVPLSDRVLGRTAAEDVVDPLSGDTIVEKGTLMTEPVVDRIDTAGTGIDQDPVGSDLRKRWWRLCCLLRP